MFLFFFDKTFFVRIEVDFTLIKVPFHYTSLSKSLLVHTVQFHIIMLCTFSLSVPSETFTFKSSSKVNVEIGFPNGKGFQI